MLFLLATPKCHERWHFWPSFKENQKPNCCNNKRICKYTQSLREAEVLWTQCRFHALMHSQENVSALCCFIFTLRLFVWCKNKDPKGGCEFTQQIFEFIEWKKEVGVVLTKHFVWIDWIKLTTQVIALIRYWDGIAVHCF